MAVIKDYYRNTKDFMRCTGLSKKELQSIAGTYSIAFSGVDFNYPKYNIPERVGITDCLEFLLYSGFYGSFPIPSHAPSFLSERDKKRLNLDYDSWGDLFDQYLDESCIDNGFSMAISAFDLNLSDPELSYKDLYSVVWFLLCLREELITANYHKRKARYNSLIYFGSPVYYQREDYMEEWSSTNNVLIACAISTLVSLQLFLACTFFFNEEDNYNFICNSWSSADLKRLLPGYRCVTSAKAYNTLCTVLEKILHTIEYYECVIKHIPVKTSSSSFLNWFIGPSVDDLVKRIFGKISRLESYVRLL